MNVAVQVAAGRVLGRRDPRIYGHFIEHFHRQVYGGVYEPGLPACRRVGPPRRRAARPCGRSGRRSSAGPAAASPRAYHWKDGVGRERAPAFDKAWRVEEPNTFGTDEFVACCRRVGAEPYICTNAGSGTAEEMSDWVEYCNLLDKGRWARQRRANGHAEPYAVRLLEHRERELPGRGDRRQDARRVGPVRARNAPR